MRHLIAAASIAATLTLLISTPVLARTTVHGGGPVVSHPHRVMGANRFIFISRTGFDNRAVFFDRFSRRFIAMPRHGFDRFDRTDGFGARFDRTDGFGGLGWDGVPSGWDSGPGAWANYGSALADEPPGGEFGALPLPPPRSPAALPPCHETTPVGIVVERGGGCTH